MSYRAETPFGNGAQQDGYVTLFNSSKQTIDAIRVFELELELEDGQQMNFRFYSETGEAVSHQLTARKVPTAAKKAALRKAVQTA